MDKKLLKQIILILGCILLAAGVVGYGMNIREVYMLPSEEQSKMSTPSILVWVFFGVGTIGFVCTVMASKLRTIMARFSFIALLVGILLGELATALLPTSPSQTDMNAFAEQAAAGQQMTTTQLVPGMGSSILMGTGSVFLYGGLICTVIGIAIVGRRFYVNRKASAKGA